LNHPNVVAAIDVGEAGTYKFFVMEYVEGPTVAQLLARGGAMAPDRAVGIVIQVARALDHALANGMVHRDVKPANIILTETGVPKLCDLGLAKEVEKEGSDTQQGETLGTPDYIAPEQARGDLTIDIRADIYSLGATLFHMVTGTVPFAGPTPAVVMALHLTEPVPDARSRNPSVPARLSAAIRKMMAKDPADRFQAPAEVIDALSRADEEDPGAAPLPRIRRRRPRF
jgi:serine/threonine-protein kinase